MSARGLVVVLRAVRSTRFLRVFLREVMSDQATSDRSQYRVVPGEMARHASHYGARDAAGGLCRTRRNHQCHRYRCQTCFCFHCYYPVGL